MRVGMFFWVYPMSEAGNQTHPVLERELLLVGLLDALDEG